MLWYLTRKFASTHQAISQSDLTSTEHLISVR